MTKEELEQILENHNHWLKEDCEDWENLRANLEGANLEGANLKEANLKGANLEGANLEGANLEGANLKEANLEGANLEGANFYGANLNGANLKEANLEGANLEEANLNGAYLNGANLEEAKNIPYIPMVCPEEGKFIGWKKAEGQGKVIVKLEIPASAKRSSSTTRKCRCDKAKVLEIYNLDGTVAEERKCYSNYDNDFIYEVGKTVKVDDFNEDRWNECSQGIHFFINRQEAINY